MDPIIVEDAEVLISESADLFKNLAGASLLLTGGGGFLGSYLLRILAHYNQRSERAEKVRVVAADNFVASAAVGKRDLQGGSEIIFENLDVTKPLTWGTRFDWIIHGASIASPTYYRQYPLETIDVNVNGCWRMLDLAREHRSRGIVFLSSSEIYGDPTPEWIPTPESYRGLVSCTGPRACYDESKRLGETLCATFHSKFQVPVKMVRPFNVYGPGQRLNDKRIVPDLMSAALAGGPIVLLSDGTPTRSFCYVRDFIKGLLLVLTKGAPGEAYNVGTAEEVSMLDAAQVMAELAGAPGHPLEVQYQTSEDRLYLTDNPNRRCPDLTKIEGTLGYRAHVSLRSGLGRTFRSYLATRPPMEA